MWRKAEENKAQPSPDTSPPSGVPSPRHPPAAAPPVSPNAPAWVSQGIKIKGEISGRGDVFVDGVFEGNIHIADGSFTVGPNARVTAEIEAREIIVHGEVIGTLKGERVQVSGTGRVTGDMETRGIVIEDGAVLRSKVQVRQEDKPPQPPPPAVLPRAKEAAAAAGTQAKDQEQ
jgi:cytoskeletal protein CcmA (bactofilin family)